MCIREDGLINKFKKNLSSVSEDVKDIGDYHTNL